jgi:hypothetical protein
MFRGFSHHFELYDIDEYQLLQKGTGGKIGPFIQKQALSL